MAWLGNIAKRFTSSDISNDAPESAPQDQAFHEEAAKIDGYKKEALAIARAQVEPGKMPTLEDYQAACVTVGLSHNLSAKDWNPHLQANLSGQDLSGFYLSDPKERDKHESHNAMAEIYDQDGNHQIDVKAVNKFYDEIKLDGAKLDNAYIEPASSFNEQIAKAESLNNVTFDGMQDGDKFTFHARQHHGHSQSHDYNNITLKNVKGGEIVFDSGSHVHGLEIEGQSATITVNKHATIDHLTVSEDLRIVTLNMGKGSVISHSDLSRANTLDMGSNLQGSVWQDVKLGSNIKHVDFTGATLKNVSVVGDANEQGQTDPKPLAGVDLTGAHIQNLTVNGKLVKSMAELQKTGAIVDSHTKIDADKALIAQENTQDALAKAAKIGEEAKNWMNGSPATTEQSNLVAVNTKPDKGKESTAYDRSYYARMSETNGGRNT